MREVARGLVNYIVVAVIAIALAGGALWWLGRDRGGPIADGTAPTKSTATPTPESGNPDATLGVTLFFADGEGLGLVSHEVEIVPTGDPATEAAATLRALLAGPPEDAGLYRVLPDGVGLRALYLDGKGTAVVDLTGVGGNPMGGTWRELLGVYAVIDTLAYSFPEDVKRVRFLLDGREATTLAGHVAIDMALTPRRDLVIGSL